MEIEEIPAPRTFLEIIQENASGKFALRQGITQDSIGRKRIAHRKIL